MPEVDHKGIEPPGHRRPPERSVLRWHDQKEVALGARADELAAFFNDTVSAAEDARFVLNRICEEVVEMTPNRDANYCCSGGGGALIAGFKKARMHYGKVKVDQIDRTGADRVCTPCVNCYDALENLARDYERPWKPVHLWKLLADAIVTK